MIKDNQKNINTRKYWDLVYSKGLDPRVVKEDEFKFKNIANHIEDSCAVVDFGCGTGEFVRTLKKHRSHCIVYGVDFSPEAIRQAKNSSDEAIEYRCEDVTKTNFAGESFDYAVSLETLEHLDDPEALINEMARVLRPAGKLILTTPYLDHIPSKEHVNLFDYSDVENLLKKHFKKYWVFPWAAGWVRVEETESKKVVYWEGHWCTIMALAIK